MTRWRWLWGPLDEPVEAESAKLVAEPALVEASGRSPRSGARWARRSAALKPAGCEAEDDERREQRLGPRVGEAEGRDALAVDLAWLGQLPDVVSPRTGSWLIRWTSRRRRLACAPTSRRAGRLTSRLPIPKSRASLMTVSVRSALPSLWYCLMRELL